MAGTVIQWTVKRNGGRANSVVTITANTALYKHAKANLPFYTNKKKNIDDYVDGQLNAKQKISFALK